MMRGPDKLACVVRGPDGLVVKEKELRPTPKILKLPFIRGVYGFGNAMKEAFESLSFSADIFPEEEEESKFEKWLSE